VRLLVDSYTPDFWFFESVDLLRKLLLTSVVVLVAPHTKLQLYFGQFIAQIAFAVLLRCEPYRASICGHTQLLAQLSVVLAYMVANVFFLTPAEEQQRRLGDTFFVEGDNETWLDLLLIGVNGAVVAGAAVWYGVTLYQADVAGRINTVTFCSFGHLTRRVEEGSKAKVPRSIYADGTLGWHLFVSHVWKHAQDQASAVKYSLHSRFPELRVFLDVDNLDSIRRLEEHVRQSDAVLVFLTLDYLKSKNCRRELTEAIAQRKTILLVRETKEEQGAPTVEQLCLEAGTVPTGTREREAADQVCARLLGCSAPAVLLPEPCIVLCIEWYRERYLRSSVLFDHICTQLPCFADGVTHPCSHKSCSHVVETVYVSPHYEHIAATVVPGVAPMSTRAQLCAGLEAAGITVVDTPAAEAAVVVLLCDGTFTTHGDAMSAHGLGSGIVDELAMLLTARGPFARRPRVVALASTASRFEDYMRLCPQALDELGLFSLMFNKWPATCADLQPVAAAHAVAHAERHAAQRTLWVSLEAIDEARRAVLDAVRRVRFREVREEQTTAQEVRLGHAESSIAEDMQHARL